MKRYIETLIVCIVMINRLGAQSLPDEHAYLVAIIEKSSRQFICGGTIIDKQWILTSGSPVVGQLGPEDILVLAGVDNYHYQDNDDLGDSGQILEVAEYFYTDNYTEKMALGNSALLKLAEPLKYNTKVYPLNMLDVSYNQSRILAYYQYNDADITTFLTATEPRDKELVGWDIYGNKTSVPVEADLSDADWFKDWSRGIYWGYSDESHQAASAMMSEKAESKVSPRAIPFYRPLSTDDNILTYGFTGGPLVCDGKLCGVSTWWMQSILDGVLSTEVQGDPEAILAVRRWIDYSTMFDPFVMAVTSEGDTPFERTGFWAGIGNSVPTSIVHPDFNPPYEVLGSIGNEDLYELTLKAREIISWQNRANTKYQYLASDRVILKPGFHMNSNEPTTQLLGEVTSSHPALHARIAPLSALVDVVGLMMNTRSLDLGFMMIQELWPEAAIFSYNGEGVLFSEPLDQGEMPPIAMLTEKRSRESSADQMRGIYNDNGGGERPTKRSRSSGGDGGDGGDGNTGGGGAGGGGDGGDGNNGGNGGDGNNGGNGGDEEEEDDDEGEEMEVDLHPNDRTLTFAVIEQIIDWDHVQQHGGLDHDVGADLTGRLRRCDLQLIWELFFHANHINNELQNQQRRDFIQGLLIQFQELREIVNDIIDRHALGLRLNDPQVFWREPIDFTDWQIRLLQPYGFDQNALQGEILEAFDQIPDNRGFYNTYQNRGLHARVIEQHINWDVFRGVNPANGYFDGVDELIQNLIVNATHLVIDGIDPVRRNHILALYNHIRRTRPNGHDMDEDLYRYYNWRPQSEHSTDPPDRCHIEEYDDTIGHWEYASTSGFHLQRFALYLHEQQALLNWYNDFIEIAEPDDTDIDDDNIDDDSYTKEEYYQLQLVTFLQHFVGNVRMSVISLGLIERTEIKLSHGEIIEIDETFIELFPQGHTRYDEMQRVEKAMLALLKWLRDAYINRYLSYFTISVEEGEYEDELKLTTTPQYQTQTNNQLRINYPLSPFGFNTTYNNNGGGIIGNMRADFNQFLYGLSYIDIRILEAVFQSHMNSYRNCRAAGRSVSRSLSEFHLRLYQYLLTGSPNYLNDVYNSAGINNVENLEPIKEIINYIQKNTNAELVTDPYYYNLLNAPLNNPQEMYREMRDNRLQLFRDRYGYSDINFAAGLPNCDLELLGIVNTNNCFVQNRTLDVGMLMRMFHQMLDDIRGDASFANQNDLAEKVLNGDYDEDYTIETAENLFQILLLVKAEPGVQPWLDDITYMDGHFQFYEAVIEFIRFLIVEYIPANRANIRARFNITEEELLDLLSGPFYSRYFLETRGIYLRLIEYYIDWESYNEARNNGQSILSSLGCQLSTLRRLIWEMVPCVSRL